MAISVATATQYLEEAEAALHALMVGGSARVVVDQNGERVEYTSANRQALQAWITKLEGIIAGKAPTVGPLQVLM